MPSRLGCRWRNGVGPDMIRLDCTVSKVRAMVRFEYVRPQSLDGALHLLGEP